MVRAVSRRYRRRRVRPRVRLYLRGHCGCLGCSVPLLAVLGVLVALVLLAL
jgi:hypothetical protein